MSLLQPNLCCDRVVSRTQRSFKLHGFALRQVVAGTWTRLCGGMPLPISWDPFSWQVQALTFEAGSCVKAIPVYAPPWLLERASSASALYSGCDIYINVTPYQSDVPFDLTFKRRLFSCQVRTLLALHGYPGRRCTIYAYDIWFLFMELVIEVMWIGENSSKSSGQISFWLKSGIVCELLAWRVSF